MSATASRASPPLSWPGMLAASLFVCGVPAAPAAQSTEPASTEESRESRAESAGRFVAGIAGGFLSHEGGHLLFNVIFDADPGLRRVEFAGIPFFAITHRADLSSRREYAVSGAGFWIQHTISEWVLTTHPQLRAERRPLLKGLLTWHVLSSAIYTAAAAGRIGPVERDTRGMAAALGVSERWIGALVMVPAVCDTWRYIDPDARWPRWLSRGAKIGLVLAIVGAQR